MAGITVGKSVQSELISDNRGPFLKFAYIPVTGLTASASNTIPHGLPFSPRVVVPVAMPAGSIALDDTQGNADPDAVLTGGHLGFDSTNVYVVCGAGAVEALLLIMY